MGYSIKPEKDQLHLILKEYIDKARNFKWQEFIMGIMLIFMLIGMKVGGDCECLGKGYLNCITQ